MEKKNAGDMTASNGKGFLDNAGLCDSLISDLNRIPKLLIIGQNVAFCDLIAKMAQKITNLKKGISEETRLMKEKVDELKRMNDNLMEQITGLPVEKDGESNGSN